MSHISPEGRPPTEPVRVAGWRWVRIVVPCIVGAVVIGVVIFVGSDRVPGATLIMALAFIVILAAAASPVWMAGLLRSREERVARRRAKSAVSRTRRV